MNFLMSGLFSMIYVDILLNLDNIIILSLLIRDESRKRQFQLLLLAVAFSFGIKVLLLGMINQVSGVNYLMTPVRSDFTVKDVIVALGGIFLILKGIFEIHGQPAAPRTLPSAPLKGFLYPIILLSAVYSLDSVMAVHELSAFSPDMITALAVSAVIMIYFFSRINAFIVSNPSVEILVLGYMILIGFSLIMEAVHRPIPTGYIHFAILFSLVMKVINLRKAGKKKVPMQNNTEVSKYAA